jgi:hypothetical protein
VFSASFCPSVQTLTLGRKVPDSAYGPGTASILLYSSKFHDYPFPSNEIFISRPTPLDGHISGGCSHYSPLQVSPGIRNLFPVKVLVLHIRRRRVWISVDQWLKEALSLQADSAQARRPMHPKSRITPAVPVSHPRHDDSLNVPKDAVPTVRFLRSTLRQLGSQVARLHIWGHPPLPHSAQVVANVIHHLSP